MVTYKSKQEIEVMHKAGTILREALDKGIGYVRKGMRTNELDEYIENQIVSKGAEAGFKRVPGYSWATCICVNEQVVHTPPSDRIIEDGDVVTIDAGAYLDGFHTDSATTVQVGKTSADVQRFIETGKRALKAAIGKAVLGNRIGHISKAFQDEIEESGYSIIFELTGHGVGKDLHEDPYVPCFLDRPVEKTGLLKEGMTLALEVMYAMGSGSIKHENDGWTIRTKDRSLTACFEHTVAIVPNGPFILT